MERERLAENIAHWRARLREASGDWGGVEICAVTKTVPPEMINRAYELGIRTIGENRVQELLEKLPALNHEFSIHVIGQLQTNKVKYIIPTAALIQSVDRLALAEEISKRAQRADRVIDVLIQVNIAREAQKSGVDERELEALLRAAAALPGIHVKGLMAIMPLCEDPEAVRPYFKRMRTWFDRLKETAVSGVDMEVLSMGMSGDCLVAAQEGATMVRLGSALFGRRI